MAGKVRKTWRNATWKLPSSLTGCPLSSTAVLDRVDYNAARDTFCILDYKTGDSGKDPDARHRSPASKGPDRAWTDLQLPLYRKLLEAQGVPAERIEVGYVLLSADLKPVTVTPNGRHEGGIGFVSVPWTEADYDAALACAEGVIRGLRAGVFWPPAAPPRFTDPFSGLCLDACRDRADWLAAGEDAVCEHAYSRLRRAGKTYALTTEYLRLLYGVIAPCRRGRGLRPASLLAATFTRKAAGEIFDRILFRLAIGGFRR